MSEFENDSDSSSTSSVESKPIAIKNTSSSRVKRMFPEKEQRKHKRKKEAPSNDKDFDRGGLLAPYTPEPSAFSPLTQRSNTSVSDVAVVNAAANFLNVIQSAIAESNVATVHSLVANNEVKVNEVQTFSEWLNEIASKKGANIIGDSEYI
jgi:hypothetical protein